MGLDDNELSCSFCGMERKQVAKLIVGQDNVAICDGCVTLSAETMYVETEADRFKKSLNHINERFDVLEGKIDLLYAAVNGSVD